MMFLVNDVGQRFFQFYVFAYRHILYFFLNGSDKNGVRGLPHSMSHAYSNILVKVSSEMLQNCGNAYVNFNSASFFLTFSLTRCPYMHAMPNDGVRVLRFYRYHLKKRVFDMQIHKTENGNKHAHVSPTLRILSKYFH